MKFSRLPLLFSLGTIFTLATSAAPSAATTLGQAKAARFFDEVALPKDLETQPDVVFQSAASGGTQGEQVGQGTDAEILVGTRFTAANDFKVTGLGTNLSFLRGGSVFLAITPIPGVTSFPDAALSGTIFHGVVTPVVSRLQPFQDYIADANFVLPAGSYAISVGDARFGAAGGAFLSVKNFESNGAGDFAAVNGVYKAHPNSGARLFVLGAPVVPLPPALWSGLSALLGLGALACVRRARTNATD